MIEKIVSMLILTVTAAVVCFFFLCSASFSPLLFAMSLLWMCFLPFWCYSVAVVAIAVGPFLLLLWWCQLYSQVLGACSCEAISLKFRTDLPWVSASVLCSWCWGLSMLQASCWIVKVGCCLLILFWDNDLILQNRMSTCQPIKQSRNQQQCHATHTRANKVVVSIIYFGHAITCM